MGVLEKAPNIVVVCATTLIGLAIAGVVLLVALGRSPAEVTHIIDTVLNSLGILAGTGAFLYSAASAKTGHSIEQRLNGELDQRISNAVADAIRKTSNEISHENQ